MKFFLHVTFGVLGLMPFGILAQELPVEETEFVNIDPTYNKSLRIQMGLLEPLQNDKLKDFYSGLYCLDVAYLFNINNKYLLGPAVSHFAIQNTLRDSALFTLIQEQVRNNHQALGLKFGYEFYTGKKSILSFVGQTGWDFSRFYRKKNATQEIIAQVDENFLTAGLGASWNYFVEEKFTCGAFLNYQWTNHVYEPSKLGYAQERTLKKSQFIQFGMVFNFGSGSQPVK